jgi:hypothetical protein
LITQIIIFFILILLIIIKIKIFIAQIILFFIVILLIILKIKIFKIFHQDPIKLGHGRPIELELWRRTQDNRVLPQTQDYQALCYDPNVLAHPNPPSSRRVHAHLQVGSRRVHIQSQVGSGRVCAQLQVGYFLTKHCGLLEIIIFSL